MVGEATAYVQSLGLKAVAAVVRRLTNSPVTRGALVAISLEHWEYETLGTAIALILFSPNLIIWAIIKLFRKQVRHSLLIIFSSFASLAIGGYLMEAELDQDAPADAYTRRVETPSASVASASASETTPTATATQQPPNEPAWKAAGFPSFRAAALAKKELGVKSFEAIKLRDNDDAIARWCDMSARMFALSRQRDAELEANPGEQARRDIFGKYDALQRELQVNLASQLGIAEWELNNLSMNAAWATHCRAQNRSWGTITPKIAAATSRSDAKEALKALRAFYKMNLERSASPYFDNSRYGAVSCKRKNVDDQHLVGCILQSFSTPSTWDVFVVGRLQNGQLAVAPIDGLASSHITSVGDLKSFQAPNAPRARLAEFAGQIDQSAVAALFD
ncbi:hypothetical protein OL67_002956 [Phaeobacter piscinae]|nr:hypothetical protein OL67_002956 [Phaeobacter piscinae]